jgi:transcriptional regulator with XRE-family HTH domain
MVLGRLLELSRRGRGLRADEVADAAGVALTDVMALEGGVAATVNAEVVVKLADTLQIPRAIVLHLAGLLPESSVKLEEAALRFAARSMPVDPISAGERDALDELLRAAT